MFEIGHETEAPRALWQITNTKWPQLGVQPTTFLLDCNSANQLHHLLIMLTLLANDLLNSIIS